MLDSQNSLPSIENKSLLDEKREPDAEKGYGSVDTSEASEMRTTMGQWFASRTNEESGVLSDNDGDSQGPTDYRNERTESVGQDDSEDHVTSSETVIFREAWNEKQKRVRGRSPFGLSPGWRLVPVIVKVCFIDLSILMFVRQTMTCGKNNSFRNYCIASTAYLRTPVSPCSSGLTT